MNYLAWPFLVGANRYLDYRTIVAPDFLCEAHNPALISAIVQHEEKTRADSVLLQEIVISHPISLNDVYTKQISLIYRTVEADGSYVGPNDSEPLRDRHGRIIYLTEGFLILGAAPRLTKEDFNALHTLLQKPYQSFWAQQTLPDAQPAPPLTTQTLAQDGVPLSYQKLATLERAYKNFLPAGKQYYFIEGSTLLQQQKYPEAVEAFDKALGYDASDVSLYLAKGRSLLALGARSWMRSIDSAPYKQAVSVFEKAITLCGENRPTLKAGCSALLAKTYLDLGDLQKAYATYCQALQLDNYNKEVLELLVDLGRQADIVNLLRK